MKVRPSLVQVARRPEEPRTPGSRLERVRRLLVVRHDRLGDLVLTLPTVALLRQTYPEAEMGLLVAPSNAPLASLVEGVDRVLQAANQRETLRRLLFDFAPDLIVCVSRGAAIPFAAWRAKVAHRVGSGYRYYSPLFDRQVREHRSGGERHEAEYALSFAHLVGAVPGRAVFPLRLTGEAESEAARWREAHGLGKGYVVLHPGTGGSCPAWPVDHYLELAAKLKAAGTPVLFSVGPQDRAIRERLEASPPEVARIPGFTGPLPVLAALLSGAALMVSNTTGPMHLASALGTPALSIQVPWPTCGASRWGPYAANGWTLVADCSGAADLSRGERRRLGDRLLHGLDPEIALACARRMLRGQNPDPG